VINSTLPKKSLHKGGGDRKAFCTSVFLLIQRY
jgi:hypothetical protein